MDPKKVSMDYWLKHPEVTVLNPPDARQHVHNCQSMLQDVADLNLSYYGYGKMPEYEHIFTDFLLSLVQGKYKRRPVNNS